MGRWFVAAVVGEILWSWLSGIVQVEVRGSADKAALLGGLVDLQGLYFDSSTSPAAVQPWGFRNSRVEDSCLERWYGPKLVFVQCLPRLAIPVVSLMCSFFLLLLFQLRSA